MVAKSDQSSGGKLVNTGYEVSPSRVGWFNCTTTGATMNLLTLITDHSGLLKHLSTFSASRLKQFAAHGSLK